MSSKSTLRLRIINDCLPTYRSKKGKITHYFSVLQTTFVYIPNDNFIGDRLSSKVDFQIYRKQQFYQI